MGLDKLVKLSENTGQAAVRRKSNRRPTSLLQTIFFPYALKDLNPKLTGFHYEQREQ